MSDVHDVAAYILAKRGSMSAMKLQKLVYYSQAWHLVWADRVLFTEHIEAWANGPVVYELFDGHRGQFSVDTWPDGNAAALTTKERKSIDAVLAVYGDLDARKLSHLTHFEDPWRLARGGLPATARSNAEITPQALADYYTAVAEAEDATSVDALDWEAWEAGRPSPSQ